MTNFSRPTPFTVLVYLAGFALTLMFVIARLVELMQEIVNQEEDKDSLSQRLKDIGDSAESKMTMPVTDISAATDTAPALRKRSAATANADKKD